MFSIYHIDVVKIICACFPTRERNVCLYTGILNCFEISPLRQGVVRRLARCPGGCGLF